MYLFFVLALSVLMNANARSYADVVELVMPTVVTVTTITSGSQNGESKHFKNTGSGFMISSDGLFITTHHTIENAEEINIVTHDNKKYKADVVGSDPRSDIALLKIDSKSRPHNIHFKHVNLGSSDAMRVGDAVIAVGNQFNIGQAVTAGIISAKSRYIDDSGIEFIQTDAAVNQGNSGGPLFNENGDIIAVNTSIASLKGSHGNIGIGFAIPIEKAMEVVNKLKNNLKITAPWLGISYYYVEEGILNKIKNKNLFGAFVKEVTPNSPASKAGIKEGDIILDINNQKVYQDTAISQIINRLADGTKIKVTIWRFNQKIEKEIIIEEK